MGERRVLDLSTLRDAVRGGVAAIRSVTELQPAGGAGDKIFPPTYAVADGKLKYALETRRVGDREVFTVLLDSVASQANRMEEALLDAVDGGELGVPIVAVDFAAVGGDVAHLGQVTTLQAPHRIADALLRDSLLDGKPFRLSDVGRAFSASSTRNAVGLWRHCPSALVFGMWDSTGPRGGLGAKFARVIVSEIVGLDAVPGVATSSRLDPAGIQREAAVIYVHKDDPTEWTLDPDEAAGGPKKPQKVKAGGDGKAGKPSAINHGNIAPSLDALAGGVTIAKAVQTTVLSLPALRRLRFPTDSSGNPWEGDARQAGELAARTTLAALALAAATASRESGYDLRSRSLLVPSEPPRIELLPSEGGDPVMVDLDRGRALSLVAEAYESARGAGLGWHEERILLQPADKLVSLIERSHSLAAAGDGDDSGS